MKMTLVVAMAENNVIGCENGLPWHLPADLKRFKAVTIGYPIIMGRLTFDSIGRPLPGRESIVVTRNVDWEFDGVSVAHSLDEAVELAKSLSAAKGLGEYMVVGGANIYEQAISKADRLCVTEIHKAVIGDAYFPSVDLSQWRELSRVSHLAESTNKPAYSFVEYEKVQE
ncbi:MAG: dihydrofolate reductase [Flavobacteriales bacterium]|jgi:dihydrofolate reductase